MPTSQYVCADRPEDPDETVLDLDETLLEDGPAEEDPPRFAFDPTSRSSLSSAARPSAAKRSKKARLRQLAEAMDSDESDEELSERAFLENLAKRQREQRMILESQTQHRPCVDVLRRGRGGVGKEGGRDGSQFREVSHGLHGQRMRNNLEQSFCTQDTTQINNRTMDNTADRTLPDDTTTNRNTSSLLDDTSKDPIESQWDTQSFEETQPWERELAAGSILQPPFGGNAGTAGGKTGDNSATPKPAAVANPYRKQPRSGVPNGRASEARQPRIPTMSFEQLKRHRRESLPRNDSDNTAGMWQREAYRSSLLDLIRSFDDASNANGRPAEDDESPTTSAQTLASSQLSRKRCFEAASRALARLAIMSRSSPSADTPRNEEREPPSPRSLPSFMSVMNAGEDGRRGGEEGDAFAGESAHGRSGRTVFLRSGEGNGAEDRAGDSEEITAGAVELAADVCRRACRGKGSSPALAEASLEFLATAFACLESDLVYSMLLLPPKSDTETKATLFDVLIGLAPNATQEAKSNISTLAFLALSRGLEATHFVARYATSLDPAACCASYASPYSIIGNANENCLDEGGVGWLSALGRDLGLHLESDEGFRIERLNEIAKYAYNAILEFNPMITGDNSQFLEASSDGNKNRRGRQNESLRVDTAMGNDDEFQCRQPSVVKDRMFAAHVEFLSSMIQIGVVSGWLHPSDSTRAVEKLCQKLFLVIETRSRLRRSTNQSNAKNDPGDSESVCAASLSLLLLSLPKHKDTSSSSLSFRQMGGTTGTIADIFQSPLVKRMVELGLSSTGGKDKQKEHAKAKGHALTSIIYVMSDIVMVGGASLISSTFGRQLNEFLLEQIRRICRHDSDGRSSRKHGASIEATLLFVLHLHNGCPMVVRKAFGNYFEQSSPVDGGEETPAALLVGNLVQMCANQCFSVSACASSLLRSLLKGNPLDGTQDVLSDTIRQSFESTFVNSSIDSTFHSLVEATSSIDERQTPWYALRQRPRMCSIGDLLNACLPSRSIQQVMMSTLLSSFGNKTVADVFVELISLNNDSFDEADTLFVSLILNIISLLSKIASSQFNHDDEWSVQIQAIGEKFGVALEGTGLVAIELALGQGSSADLTYRAINYLNCLTISETTLALTLTRTRISAKRKEGYLQRRTNKAELATKELQAHSKAMEEERAKLSNALHDQTTKYEKRLELVRFETQSIAKKSAEIHIHERQRAEQHALKCERLYHDEKELRLSTEQQNKDIVEESTRLSHELSRSRNYIAELQKLLDQERKEKEEYAAALKTGQRELKLTSKELENCIGAKAEIEDKLSTCEKTVNDVTAANKDLGASLEDACEKLINLSTVYQRKEAEMDKYKAELRCHVNAANKNADTAISKYESSRKEARALRKDLEIALSELNELKAHRADVQRLKKNAPTSYINQLRNDPRVQAQPRKSRSGKENSFGGR